LVVGRRPPDRRNTDRRAAAGVLTRHPTHGRAGTGGGR
jgi:hypothetical protein